MEELRMHGACSHCLNLSSFTPLCALGTISSSLCDLAVLMSVASHPHGLSRHIAITPQRALRNATTAG